MHIYAQALHTHTHTLPAPHTNTRAHTNTHNHTPNYTWTHRLTYTHPHKPYAYTHTQNHPPKHLTVTHPLSRYVSGCVGGQCVGMGRVGGCLLSFRVCVCLCMGVCVSLCAGGVYDCLFGYGCGRVPVCVGRVRM